jgi:hypothetical protein
MATTTVRSNAYTDAPQIHANPILGSLQLWAWFFFHPAAWRSYLARIDPRLSPNFCLAELNASHWRNSALVRLLVMGYLAWPAAAALVVGLALWVSGRLGAGFIFGVLHGMAIGLALGVAVGAVIGMAIGFVATAAFTLLLGTAGVLLVDVIVGSGFGLIFGMMGGLAGYLAGHVTSREAAFSFARQIGGMVIGLIVSGVVLAASIGGVLGTITVWAGGSLSTSMMAPIFSLVPSIMFGLAVGWRTRRWRRGVMAGLALGLLVVLAFEAILGGKNYNQDYGGLALLDAFTVMAAVVFSVTFALSFVVAEDIAGAWAGALAGMLVSQGIYLALWVVTSLYSLGLNLGLSVALGLLGLSLPWWLPALLYPFQLAWNTLLYRLDVGSAGHRPSRLGWHSAFWHEFQWLPLYGLEEHLVWAMELRPLEGQAALDYLSTHRQRWAAQAAQIELDARELEACTDATAISRTYQGLGAEELAGLTSPLLRSFSRVSQDVEAALRQGSAYNQRLVLRAVEERLDGLLRELTRSSDRYAARFRPIAAHWRRIVAEHMDMLTQATELRQEIDNPYIFGLPLTEHQEIFVGRRDIGTRIEQLLLDRRRPPLLLYGQRRMGKTSLLNNLGRLLPTTIVPLFVDLQGASRARNHAGLLYNITRQMVKSASQRRNLALPQLSREALENDPFTRFYEWLDEVEGILDAQGQNTALLALDEFETLDSTIAQGRFDEEDVLGMLRYLIQHYPRFKVMLAGSHTLGEFQRWASYLINAQVVHISYLNGDEARQLIERPVEGFALRYEPEASQWVLDLSRGHPALVQLLCAEIVTLKNEQAPALRRLARLVDVEEAALRALNSGSLFFADIQCNQVDATGLALLRFLAVQGEGVVVGRKAVARQFPHQLDHTLDLLIRRELIEGVDTGYRFQVELTRRWFAQQVMG